MVYKLGNVDWLKFSHEYGFGYGLSNLDQTRTRVDLDESDAYDEVLGITDDRGVFREAMLEMSEEIEFLVYRLGDKRLKKEARELFEEARRDFDILTDWKKIKHYIEDLRMLGIKHFTTAYVPLVYLDNPIAEYRYEFDGESLASELVATPVTSQSTPDATMLLSPDIESIDLLEEPKEIARYLGADLVIPTRPVDLNEHHSFTKTETVSIADAIAKGCGAES